jgi:hypothetical protein
MTTKHRNLDDWENEHGTVGLTRSQEDKRETYIRRGQDAWKRHKSDATWTDWVAIGEAHMLLRQEAMSTAHTNQPVGSRYNADFGDLLRRHGFDDMDKADRARLFEVMEHQAAIEQWRATLPQTTRLRINHPSTVLRRWKAATQVPAATDQPKKPSAMAVLKEQNVELQEKLHRLESDDGGNLWRPGDTAKNIASVLGEHLLRLSPAKATEVLNQTRVWLQGRWDKMEPKNPVKEKKHKPAAGA